MGKTVWIINHYASHMLFDKGGRHYYFAKYLNIGGFNPIVFCANTQNYQTDQLYYDNEALWNEGYAEEIQTPFIFVKARRYKGNGKQRILNMLDFYRNVKKTAIEYAKKNGKPDIIIASSVHPLTMVAGIQLAKKFGIKCISEVRDLWPESIVAYSSKWTETNPVIRLLYLGEKWIYKKSDAVIMTWAGGYDYIKDKGWQKSIPESKIIHISNGVDLDSYMENASDNIYKDSDLSNKSYKNFIYAGSIRKVNNIAQLVLAAKILNEKDNNNARILVFGDGDELEKLKDEARGLDNIVFKGRVSKSSIPSILSQGYASILHNRSTELDKYGQSQNKFFEYLAAGRPILMTYSVGHSVIKKNGCGVELDVQSPESIAQAVTALSALTDREYQKYCDSATDCAKKYDYKELSNLLISLINQNTYY